MRAYFTFVFIAVCSLLPLLVLIVYAVAPGWTFPELVPSELDWRALQYAASQWQPILRHLSVSVLYSLAVVALSLVLCLFPAHHFAYRRFRGKSMLEGVFLAPALVPSMTFSMGAQYLFIRVGLTDTLFGVVLVLTAFSYPYMLRALTAGYQAVGEEYELCARNLGAGFWMRLLRIELPLLMPSVIAGGSVVFLVAFSEYFLVFLIGGGAVDSYTGYLFPYLASSDRSMGSLLCLVFLAVPVLLFLLVEYGVSRIYRERGMY